MWLSTRLAPVPERRLKCPTRESAADEPGDADESGQSNSLNRTRESAADEPGESNSLKEGALTLAAAELADEVAVSVEMEDAGKHPTFNFSLCQ